MTWEATRKQILIRDDWKCVRCSGAANDVHHRKLKGIGGSKLLDGPENLISLCRKCHSHIHSHVQESYNAGYLVHSWDAPELIFIITKPGVLTLRVDGTIDLQGSYGEPLF